jgi:hypothetical protein
VIFALASLRNPTAAFYAQRGADLFVRRQIEPAIDSYILVIYIYIYMFDHTTTRPSFVRPFARLSFVLARRIARQSIRADAQSVDAYVAIGYIARVAARDPPRALKSANV